MAKILSTGSMTKTQILNRIKLIKQRAATKSDVKREHEENKPGLISGTGKDGPEYSNVELTCEILDSTNQDMEGKSELDDIETKPEIGPTNKTDREEKKDSAAEVIDTSSAPVIESDRVRALKIHKNVPVDKDVELTEIFETTTDNESQLKNKKEVITESEQQKIITNRAPPIELQSEIIPEKEGQEVNMINESTTENSTETKVGNIYTIGTINTMEEQESLEKQSSTQKSAIEPKEEEENGETIRANVDVESGPSPLTFESDEYLATEKVTKTPPNSKVEVFTNHEHNPLGLEMSKEESSKE